MHSRFGVSVDTDGTTDGVGDGLQHLVVLPVISPFSQNFWATAQHALKHPCYMVGILVFLPNPRSAGWKCWEGHYKTDWIKMQCGSACQKVSA